MASRQDNDLQRVQEETAPQQMQSATAQPAEPKNFWRTFLNKIGVTARLFGKEFCISRPDESVDV
jgi:hypothetical protein